MDGGIIPGLEPTSNDKEENTEEDGKDEMILVFCKDGERAYIKQDDLKKRLQEGVHYQRYGDLWVSIPGTFKYKIDRVICEEGNPSTLLTPITKSSPDATLSHISPRAPPGSGRGSTPSAAHQLPIVLSRSPPFFIWGLKPGVAHYNLPVGPDFYPCDTFSVSKYKGRGEEEFLAELGKIYRTDPVPPKTRYEKSYALVRAMYALPDRGDRIRYRWILDWKANRTVESDYCGTVHRKIALILHAIGAHEVIEARRPERIPRMFEVLTIVRSTMKAGWGTWFIQSDPEPTKYTLKVSYDEKRHQIAVDFHSPTYKGGFVTVRVTEFGGTITDFIMTVQNPKAKQRWIIGMAEAKGEGRGGRDPSSTEHKNKAWDTARTNDEFLELLAQVISRKFWTCHRVRYVQVDPDNKNLLLCTSLDVPLPWCYEILDVARYAPDKIPVASQIYAIRCMASRGSDDSRIYAYLQTITVVTTFKLEVRMEAMKHLVGTGWLLAKQYWIYYKQTLRPEPEMAQIVVSHGLTGPDDNLSKLELLIEMVCLSGTYPFYETMRNALLKAIDAITWEKNPKKWKGVKEEVDNLGYMEEDWYQYELKRWARIERLYDQMIEANQVASQS